MLNRDSAGKCGRRNSLGVHWNPVSRPTGNGNASALGEMQNIIDKRNE